jgi:uncharacterized protein YhaN
MQIIRMRATFGRLNGEELALSPGLNVLVAPNESGKSTWCAFIKAMLYGIDTSEREKGGVKPDKIKYAPWSGAPMAGEMEILWRGRRITLIRRTRTANAPMRQFSAVYTETNEPVPELTGQNVGLLLTGAEKAVFERSAFIRQGGLAVSGDAALSQKIATIVSTGEEDGTSYEAAAAQLGRWQRQRRYNRRGALPETEARMEEIQEELRRGRDRQADRETLQEKLRLLEGQRDGLVRQVEQSRKELRRQALERLSENKTALREAQSAFAQAEANLTQCQTEARTSIFWGKTQAQAQKEVEEALQQGKTLSAGAAVGPRFIFSYLLMALCLFCLLAGILFHPAVFIGAALCVGGAIWVYFQQKKIQTGAQQAEEALRALWDSYGVRSPEALQDLAAAYGQRLQDLHRAEEEYRTRRQELETLTEAQSGLDAGVLSQLNFDNGDNEATRLGQRLRQTEEQIQILRSQAAELSGKLQVSGDPLVLESELGTLRQRHEELSREYEALALAAQVLGEANSEIQTRFSPMLSRRATQYMSVLTEEQYTGLTLDRELTAAVRRQEDTTAWPAAFLSGGTLDQMYLALRLAICDLTLGGEEPCPVVLDDALVNFDHQRCVRCLTLLQELAQTRQILLFSCREL